MAEISKADILEFSEGMLHKELYLIHTRPVNGLGPIKDVGRTHIDFQVELEQKGIMFAAGPIFADDEETWEGEGMIIIRADSLAHAKEIAESDPMHIAGARDYTVRPWLVNEGSLTVRLTFSDGKYALA